MVPKDFPLDSLGPDGKSVAFEDLRGDEEVCADYSDYLYRWDHPVLYADGFETWLEFDPVGRRHVDEYLERMD